MWGVGEGTRPQELFRGPPDAPGLGELSPFYPCLFHTTPQSSPGIGFLEPLFAHQDSFPRRHRRKYLGRLQLYLYYLFGAHGGTPAGVEARVVMMAAAFSLLAWGQGGRGRLGEAAAVMGSITQLLSAGGRIGREGVSRGMRPAPALPQALGQQGWDSHGVFLVVLQRLLGHHLHEARVLPGDVPGHGEGQRLRIKELHCYLRVRGC